MSAGARPAALEPLFAPYQIVRELGARPQPVYAVRQGVAGGKAQLAAATCFVGAARAGNEEGARLVREARRISTIASANLARVREVAVRGDDLVVFEDLVDGEKLAELWPSGRAGGLPLDVALRFVLDVLAGAGALHNLRDAKQQPMKLAHGEISPATVVLGSDGVARLLFATARRAPGARAEERSTGYLAPEVQRGEPHDARADVFGAGALLWEAISGKRLFTETDGDAIAARVQRGDVPAATVLDAAPWAKGLVAVAAKALAAAPDDRWPTAAALAAEIRKAAGLKIAAASTASSFAKTAVAERARARREGLEVTAPQASPAAIAPDTPAESVLVAPGIRAPVADVIELDSDADVELSPASLHAPPAVPPPIPAPAGSPAPPAASPAPPRNAPQMPPLPIPVAAPEKTPAPIPAPAPAPAPALAPSPVVAADPPPSSGAPFYTAAIDPPSPAPSPLPEPLTTSPSLARQAAVAYALDRAGQRRKLLVLGSVGLVGALVFGLAGWRAVHRAAEDTRAPVMQTTIAPAPTLTSTPTSTPTPSSIPTAIPSAIPAPSPSTPAAPAPAHHHLPAAAAPPAKPKPQSPAVAAHAAAHAKPAANSHPKPHPKSSPSVFVPNSL